LLKAGCQGSLSFRGLRTGVSFLIGQGWGQLLGEQHGR